MIVSVISTKGGVGKSTFTANLAASLIAKGKDVFVIDSDPQQTLSKWNQNRNYYREQGENLSEVELISAEGKALENLAYEQSEKGKIVLIDTPGVNTAGVRTVIWESDFLITLSSPSLVDIWEIGKVIGLSREAAVKRKRKLNLALIFNKCSTNSRVKSLAEAKEFLAINGYAPDHIFENVMKERVAYQYSFGGGEAVFEHEKNGSAAKEFDRLVSEFVDLISGK